MVGRRLFQHLQQRVCAGAVQLVGAVKNHRPPLGGKRGVKHLAAHLAHPVDLDLARGPFAPHLAALGRPAGQHGLGLRPALGVQPVGRQAPGGKARAAARLAAQQHTMRKPPCAQGGLQVLFQFGVSRQPIQHHSFSNRSTLVTNTVAPPTVTCRG